MKKKVIIAMSVLVFVGATTIWAADEVKYILTKLSAPIIVNGEQYNSTAPILNYKDTTYVPLREVTNLLDKDIKWNAKQGQIEINDDYFYLEGEKEFSSPNKEFVNLINSQVKAINSGDKTAYETLFTKEGLENFPTFPDLNILITNHFIFENTTTEKTDVLVDLYYKDSADTKLKYTQSKYLLVKENNQWKIAGFSK
ncbi:copper amine oxidase N-terminal domain-containing protein [Paenibacillus endoradicis]|uniref:copper amine oxidase N-terminal domain-containing protein n=1 Tax=Paenibacillus endoradicis TaxID=2972487 RepID=UPI002158CE6E|nr:copper amine oxidase N-terminal domain-containing protein [Paenibacillus endoradicis]MCR8656549.1 copper amine oxidase N-terminal domain-containing protein [Paenibacillus endoradicis]